MQKDITDGIEAFAALYMDGQEDDGEIAGVYSTRTQAELSHRGEGVKIIRLVPAEPVIIHG